MLSKFSKIALTIVAIIIIALGYLYLAGKIKINNTTKEIAETTQETEMAETIGWKTYRNEEYRFEMKYPVNLKVNHSDIKGRSVVVDDDNFIININSVKFIKAWDIKNTCYMADIGDTRILEKIEVNGSSMPLCIDDNQKELMIFYRILIPKDKNQTISTVGDYFSVEAQVYGDFNIESRLSMFKQILSTFKFTE